MPSRFEKYGSEVRNPEAARIKQTAVLCEIGEVLEGIESAIREGTLVVAAATFANADLEVTRAGWEAGLKAVVELLAEMRESESGAVSRPLPN